MKSQSDSQELDLILNNYANAVDGIVRAIGDDEKEQSYREMDEAKAKLMELALSCLMERPEYVPGEPATTRASKSGQNFAIDTIEQKIRAKFQ